MSALSRHLPAWLRSYSRENLPHDVLAGLVVTVLVIPQSLAYALLAGLPPQAGLYASILPVLAYARGGRGRQDPRGGVVAARGIPGRARLGELSFVSLADVCV